MTAIALKSIDWYSSMLEPLDDEMKITIINRLTNSMLSKESGTKISDFSDLSSAWKDDGLTAEEEADMIRSARCAGLSRSLVDW